jgi:hypothetical protein
VVMAVQIQREIPETISIVVHFDYKSHSKYLMLMTLSRDLMPEAGYV